MIQDIGGSVFRNEYISGRAPKADDRVIVYKSGEILLSNADNTICFPSVSELEGADRGSLIYLFDIDGEGFFLYMTENGALPQHRERYAFMSVRKARASDPSPRKYLFAAFTAHHLAEWYDSSRFCGGCGAKTEHDLRERAVVCTECGRKRYPRINPAVIIGVVSGEKLLITRYRTGFAHNALVAGFTEIGESLEGTVVREVMEETGVKVKNIRYYKSQPWGIASDLLAGFFCEAEEGSAIHMDENELKYAEWLSGEEIVLQPHDHSLTNEMMKLFKERGREVLSLK